MMRHLFTLGTLCCLSILGPAYFIEYGLHVEPCTLCVLQRFVLWGITIIFSIATIHNPSGLGTLIYPIVLGFLNVSGCLIALRHLWLQYAVLAANIRPCSADLKTLLQFKPWMQALSDVLFHTEDCAVIQRAFGIPLSVLSLMSFVALGVLSIVIFKQALKK
jgi:disulfide bond formation protein DsbB